MSQTSSLPHYRGPRLDDVYAALREAVLSGELLPEQSLSETRVAAQFGVSRTPVREAFRRLADEGFLRIVPQVGTFVSRIQLTAVSESQFVRETLECRTIRLAAERIEAAEAQGLELLLLRQREVIASDRPADFFPLDEALHAELTRIAGHPSVWDLLVGVKAQLDRVRRLSLNSKSWLVMIYGQHRDIVDRVAAHDATGAEDAMRDHLRSVFATIDDIARGNGEFFENHHAGS